MQSQVIIFDKFPELAKLKPLMREDEIKLFQAPHFYSANDFNHFFLKFMNMELNKRKLIENKFLNLKSENLETLEKNLFSNNVFLEHLRDKILFEKFCFDKRNCEHRNFFTALNVDFKNKSFSMETPEGRVNLLKKVFNLKGKIIINLRNKPQEIISESEKNVYISFDSNINYSFALSHENFERLMNLVLSNFSKNEAFFKNISFAINKNELIRKGA